MEVFVQFATVPFGYASTHFPELHLAEVPRQRGCGQSEFLEHSDI
jgi:hypothetical protein